MARIRIDDINQPKHPTEEELARITGGGAVIEERDATSSTTHQHTFQRNESNLSFMHGVWRKLR